MAKIGRNDPCHCGSGKKYKHCHLKEDGEKESNNKGILIGAIIIIFVIISAFVIYNKTQSSNDPVNPPPGQAPEGKVWSEEHGHWHDK